MSKVHALNTIAAFGSLPMVKQPLPTEGRDAKMQGAHLANTVIARAFEEGNTWKRFAVNVINDLTTDGRVAFMDALKASLKDIKAKNAQVGAMLGKDGTPAPTKDETKRAAKLVNSATTQVMCLNAIAKAWNTGATTEGLCEYVRVGRKMDGATLADIGFAVIVEYARTFSDSKAGRTPDTFIVKVGKWLEKNTPAEDDKQGMEAYTALVNLYNKLAA